MRCMHGFPGWGLRIYALNDHAPNTHHMHTCTHAQQMHNKCTTHAHRALMHTARAHRSTDAPAVAVAGAEGAPRGNPVKEEEKLQVRELSLT